MSIRNHPAVKRWVTRLEELGVTVPLELSPTTMGQLLCSTAGNSAQQHAAVHLALHVHTAGLCLEAQQSGENDEVNRQAT